MHVKMFNSVRDIDESDWDEIVGHNSLICRHAYLRAIEDSEINDCCYIYPVVYEGERIVAHACLYSISTELDLFAKGILKRVINIIRILWPRFLILRSIECGTPVALGSTISFRVGSRTEEILGAIVRAVECTAKEMNIKVILFRDYYSDDLELYDCLCTKGYKRIHNLPTARMSLSWSSFGEYLQAMRHPYRRRANKRMKKNDGDVVIEFIADFSSLAEEMSVLWLNTYEKAREYRREILGAIFFENMSKELGEKSGAIIARVDGKLVGFSLLLLDDDMLEWVFCGMDYRYNSDYKVYYKMLYSIVEYGISNSYRTIDFGITTVSAKMDVGASVETQYMYMKHLAALGNMVLPGIFDKMTPQPSNTSRAVFKKKV